MNRITRLTAATAMLAAVNAASAAAQGTTATPAPAIPPAPPQASTQEQAKSGVIRPPVQVDPAMKRATPSSPQAFPMPIVRPPGTPGGNPDVIAK